MRKWGGLMAIGTLIFVLTAIWHLPLNIHRDMVFPPIIFYTKPSLILSATITLPEPTPTDAEKEEPIIYIPPGPKLTRQSGVFNGPSGKETYYNLNMSGVVAIMRNCGYSEAEYPYWVREDGVKMLGPYVMVAAALDIRPRGSLIETSLGTGIVCDTGTFVYSNPYQLDIAVSW